MMNPPLNEYTLATHQNMQSTELIGRAPTGGPPDLRNLRHTREHPQVDDVMAGVQSLRLVRRTEGPSGSEPPGGVDQLKSDGTFDDDQTHLSNSSTKPPSFDSKSMASVTTFALDEKESLRPDDSASVQAIEEDDYSGSASGAPGSQIGSETGARLNRISQMVISQRLPGATTDDISRLAVRESKILNGEPPLNILSEQILHGFPDEPDEKLFEAMRSPKDRLLILQLEEKIIAFIKNPRFVSSLKSELIQMLTTNHSEQSLELPPCNAFGRLLAHKLGDYYHLTHFVDNNVTSVRLHRTPWCRL